MKRLRLLLRLALARQERNGLRRERARWNAERNGLDQALQRNALRARVLQDEIAAHEAALRSLTIDRRFRLNGMGDRG